MKSFVRGLNMRELFIASSVYVVLGMSLPTSPAIADDIHALPAAFSGQQSSGGGSGGSVPVTFRETMSVYLDPVTHQFVTVCGDGVATICAHNPNDPVCLHPSPNTAGSITPNGQSTSSGVLRNNSPNPIERLPASVGGNGGVVH